MQASTSNDWAAEVGNPRYGFAVVGDPAECGDGGGGERAAGGGA